MTTSVDSSLDEAPIIVIGGGGHGRVIADIIRVSGATFAGFLDDDQAGSIPDLIGPIDINLPKYVKSHRFVVGIGDGPTRRALCERILSINGVLATLIHPAAVVAVDVRIDVGSVVMAGAIINPGTKVGRFVVINTGAIIDHDNVLQDNVHISPGVAHGGFVVCEEDSFIGVGATLIPRMRVGRGSMVAAGAVVTREVPEYSLVAGCPAEVKKRLARDS